ncbi:MAG TPA: hypothetical protein PKD85_16505 [Saprospiraceae bacterium]|nr:hypothetical protein [Saprospiraceae bacterium]
MSDIVKTIATLPWQSNLIISAIPVVGLWAFDFFYRQSWLKGLKRSFDFPKMAQDTANAIIGEEKRNGKDIRDPMVKTEIIGKSVGIGIFDVITTPARAFTSLIGITVPTGKDLFISK